MRWSMLMVGTVVAAGCARTAPRSVSLLASVPGELAKCRVAASQRSPLVTEWPASEKANLEALSRAGGVAVAYAGCSMRVLAECRVRGGYRWQRTTPSTDRLEINDQDELYAKLPLGAAALEGELKRAGGLAIETHVAGQLKLEDADIAAVAQDAACAQATHIVGALSVGAFALKTGGSRHTRGGASLTSLGEAGASSSRSEELVRSAGDPHSCGSGTAEAPDPNCASPLQVFLWPLPGRAAEEGPPGTVKVDFVSGNPASRWDVYADDQVICTTPCARWVHADRPVALRTRDNGLMGPSDRVQVPHLLAHPGHGHLQLQAHPTSNGKLVTGITFTTFSGMATMAGITLTALGCSSDDRAGMCKGGLITLGAGALALAGSIYLILDSRAHAQVLTDDRMTYAKRTTRWLVGPGFMAGRF